MMEATDVLDVLAVLAEDGVPVLLDGGWGVDALLGAQHRDHDDLDLVVGEEHVEAALASLVGAGFTTPLVSITDVEVVDAGYDR